MSRTTKYSLVASNLDAVSPWKPARQRNDSQYDEKREALLRTAAALFRAQGYSEVSLNELADILRITKPTLYYYVKSKDELLYEIVTRGQEEILNFMRSADRSPGTGAEKLRSIMLHYAKVITSDNGACILLVRPRYLNPEMQKHIEDRRHAGNNIVRHILATGEKDGTLFVPDPTITLHVLFGSLNWIGRWYNPAGRVGPDELIEMQVDLLLNGAVVERNSRRWASKQAISGSRAISTKAKRRGKQ